MINTIFYKNFIKINKSDKITKNIIYKWLLVLFISILYLKVNKIYALDYIHLFDISFGLASYTNIYPPPISTKISLKDPNNPDVIIQDDKLNPFFRANHSIIRHEGVRHVGTIIDLSNTTRFFLTNYLDLDVKINYSIKAALLENKRLNVAYSSSSYHSYGIQSDFWYPKPFFSSKVNLLLSFSTRLAIQEFFNVESGHRAHSLLVGMNGQFGRLDFLRLTLSVWYPFYRRFGFYELGYFKSHKINSAKYKHIPSQIRISRYIADNFILFLNFRNEYNYILIADVNDYSDLGYTVNTLIDDQKTQNLTASSLSVGFRLMIIPSKSSK